MRLEGVDLVRVDLPLVGDFRTSFGTQRTRNILLVRVFTDMGEGWGECAAHAEPFYNEEFVDASEIVLRRWLVPPLSHLKDLRPEAISPAIMKVKGYAAAKAGIEMAAMDAYLRATGRSLADYLGGTRARVAVGVSVGIAESIRQLLELVAGYITDGYARVKLKIEPGWDLEPVRAVRRMFPDLVLQVDANASYTPDAIGELVRLDDYNLLMLEQPFAADDLESHTRLAAVSITPVCLDESILSSRSAAAALDVGACSIINIKVGRVGGLVEAVRIHDLCLARGVPVWCGGMLESGIGRAANVALASLPGFEFPGDISASARYFAKDIIDAPFDLVSPSNLVVPTGPGLGVAIAIPALSELGARTQHIFGSDRT